MLIKNLLIHFSDIDKISWDFILTSLKDSDYSFFYWGADEKIIKKSQEFNSPTKASYKFYANFSKNKQRIFCIFYILIFLYGFFTLLFLKIKYNSEKIILIGPMEKIALSLSAKLLKIKVCWLEAPRTEKTALLPCLNALLKIFSRGAKVITFNQLSKDEFQKAGWKEKNISLVLPGLRLNQFKRQENIFHDLACNKISHGKNFFTVGTITDLNSNQNIEMLFGAIKKSLVVIPNLQLIIIGEGSERKNLAWLAKKINIENLTWFVGEQALLGKWLDGFNLYIPVCLKAGLNDIFSLLLAMNCEVPIIAGRDKGFEDIITADKNGLLIENDNSDAYAAAIIKLHQNKNLATMLKQNGKKKITEELNSEIMARNIIKILEKK